MLEIVVLRVGLGGAEIEGIHTRIDEVDITTDPRGLARKILVLQAPA